MRDPSNKVVAGVAAGIAEHLRLPVLVVRVAFVALLATNGVGALLYVAFWAVLPTAASAPRQRGRGGLLQAGALVMLAAGVVVAQLQVGLGFDSTIVAFVALAALGAGIIWHQAEPQRRRRAGDVAGAPAVTGPLLMPGPLTTTGPLLMPGPLTATGSLAQRIAEVEALRRWSPVPLVGGGVLVVISIIAIGFLSPVGGANVGATLIGLVFALLALAGLLLAFAPLLYRVFGQLREERVARIREQERAEVAAMVHDQVLHTLALIQRTAGDATSVVRLARGQERTLRKWLYQPVGSPTGRFAAALEQVAAEIEDAYAVTVETVVVSDAEHDERVGALVAATREALVNAARHAKVGVVSLYAEVEEETMSVYVRDRGTGFDLSTVDDDRHGVRGSIIARMQRHGGRAEVRTAPGEGTEVTLTMPRARHAKADPR
jgi:signal transduction histidine kinase